MGVAEKLRQSERVEQQERHPQLALVVGYGDPEGWKLRKGQSLMLPGQVGSLDLGGAFARPISERNLVWYRSAGVRLWVAGRNLLACGNAPVHPYVACVSGVLLLLQCVDFFQTILLLGTLCTSETGSSHCTITLVAFPLANLLAPVIAMAITCSITLLGCEMAVRSGRFITARTLSRTSHAALVRSLRCAALWNAASLLNSVIGLIVVVYVGTGLFVSRLSWILPLSLIATKLLVAQALKLLAPSLGFRNGAYSLLVGLVGQRVRRAQAIRVSEVRWPSEPPS